MLWHCCYCCWRTSVCAVCLYVYMYFGVFALCSAVYRILFAIYAMHVLCICTASHSISIYYTSWEFIQVYLHLYPIFLILYFFLPSTHSLTHTVFPFLLCVCVYVWAVCRFHFILTYSKRSRFNRSTEISHELRKKTLLLSLHMNATK